MKKIPLFLLSLAAVASAHGQVVLLNDSFSDNDRTTQNLPTSAAWYAGNPNAGTLSGNGGQLTFTVDGTELLNTHFLGYFTNSGTQSMAVGDKLTLSFQMTASGLAVQDLGLRMGFFNSGGTRVTADSLGASPAQYNGWTGYGFFTDLADSSTGQSSLRERNPAISNSLWSTSGGIYSNLSGGTGVGPGLADGTYAVSLELSLTATGMVITQTIGGFTFSRTDTTSPLTAFDTVSIGLFNQGTTAVFDNIAVTYTPAVPEPGSAGLVLGSGLLLLRRRRSSKKGVFSPGEAHAKTLSRKAGIF
jgi:hypothetical protein